MDAIRLNELPTNKNVSAYLAEEERGSVSLYYVVLAENIEEAAAILWSKREELGWDEYEVSIHKNLPRHGWAGWVLKNGEETVYVFMSKVPLINTLSGESGNSEGSPC